MNDKVYIHEFIDIIGNNRARYMHHMTANWVPIARAERNQQCFGVWGTVGSTGRWPEVVNMWELDGWEGLAANFDHELSHAGLQDPSLAEWWGVAAGLRRGGQDRIVVPTDYTLDIGGLVAAGVRGAVYAHELLEAPPGGAADLLASLPELALPAARALGAELVGAFAVAMGLATEAIVIWALPDWPGWLAYERAWDRGGPLAGWRTALVDGGATLRRTLMVEAPLSPLRLGRQPSVEDRRPLGEIS